MSSVSPLASQIDDLADSPWALPTWDAIERYREDPLCIPCIDAYDLTVLPGIGKITASRIMKLIREGHRSLEFIADSLCLTVDQFIILNVCTTFNCSCPPSIESLRWRTRMRTSEAQLPEAFTRADVDVGFARVGGFVKRENNTLVPGAWLNANTKNLTATLGNFLLKSSTGLVYGGNIFRRNLLINESAIAGIRVQPWTSSWSDRALQGVGFLIDDSLFHTPAQLAFAYSNKVYDGRKEVLIGSVFRSEFSLINVGSSLQYIQYDTQSNSTSMSAIRGLNQTLVSFSFDKSFTNATISAEAAFDQQLNAGFAIISTALIKRARLSVAMRWFGANMRSPYGSTISTQTAVGNEKGITLGTQFRMMNTWLCEVSLDLHQTQSRSYGRPQPAKGFDLIFDAARGIGQGTTLSFRLRFEQDDDGWKMPETSTTKMVVRQRATIRADYTIDISQSFRLRFRLDGRAAQFTLGKPDETGILAYAECRWQPFQSLSLRARFTTFRSPSIDVAPYAIETETDGMMRTIVGTGAGEHSIIAIRYLILNMFTIGVAYSESERQGIIERAGTVQLDYKLPSQ